MTGESIMIEPSSSTSVGILFSGFKRITSALVSLPVTLTRSSRMRSAMPSSWATKTTLRTKGERDDHSSFTQKPPTSLFRQRHCVTEGKVERDSMADLVSRARASLKDSAADINLVTTHGAEEACEDGVAFEGWPRRAGPIACTARFPAGSSIRSCFCNGLCGLRYRPVPRIGLVCYF